MGLGTNLIKACIREGDSSSVFTIQDILLTDDEREIFDYVRSHVREHGSMPSLSVLRQRRFEMGRGRAADPPSVYASGINDRYVWNILREQIQPLSQHIANRRPSEALALMRNVLSDSLPASSDGSSVSLEDASEEVLADFIEARDTPGLRGVTLGYPTLDNDTMGAQGGDLIVLAARPSIGKSWVMCNMAYQSWLAGRSVGFVTMEMGRLQISRRIVGLHTGQNPNFIRSGELSQWGERRLRQGIEEMRANGGSRFSIMSGDFDKSVAGVESFVAQTMPEILYIDAAYLLSPAAARKGHVSKWEQISSVISELKQMALRLNIPIVISVQFNRNIEGKSKKDPDLRDIGGSDSIPQDASVVIGMVQGTSPYEDTRRKIIGLKNREGSVSNFEIDFTFTPVTLGEVEADRQDTLDSSEGWD